MSCTRRWSARRAVAMSDLNCTLNACAPHPTPPGHVTACTTVLRGHVTACTTRLRGHGGARTTGPP
eukprot:755335-Rhodomonas_salina.1